MAYIIDDDLLNVPLELSSGVYYASPERQRDIPEIIEQCSAVISPSTRLIRKYTGTGQQGILLEEPAVMPAGFVPHNPGKPVSIGFAGSVDRTGDIDGILRTALLNIKSEYGKNVAFVFFGAAPACAEALDAKCIPYTNSYDAYRRMMSELQLDIGLAPMPDTEFHACKHYNKFIEYTAANTVGIFSAVKPYDVLPERFGWDLLCDNTSDSWYCAIKRLLDCPSELNVYKQKSSGTCADGFQHACDCSDVFERHQQSACKHAAKTDWCPACASDLVQNAV